MMGLTDAQMGKYLLLRGILTEYEGTDFDLIYSDADIIEEIEAVRIRKENQSIRLQVFAIIKYLLKSKRIKWVK